MIHAHPFSLVHPQISKNNDLSWKTKSEQQMTKENQSNLESTESDDAQKIKRRNSNMNDRPAEGNK